MNTQAAATSEAVFTGLVETHVDEIYNFARYMVLDYDEANDIVQKTFLSLYKNLHKLDTSTTLKPWLLKVARNHCLDYLRGKKNLHFSEVEEQVLEIPEHDESLEQQLDSQLYEQKFRQLVEQLPPQFREVLLLKYFQDLTFEQMAELLGQPEGTVKSNFYRGKSKLYAMMKSAQEAP